MLMNYIIKIIIDMQIIIIHFWNIYNKYYQKYNVYKAVLLK